MSSTSRPGPRRGASGLRAALAAAAIAVAAAGLLHAIRIWEVLDDLAFDALTVAVAGRGVAASPVVVVGIDEQSFAEVGVRWPWPRQLHAQLVDRLTEAGATAIVFDVVFSEPSEADGDFARAIAASGRVVLAGDVVAQETTHFRGLRRVEPLPAFRQAGARTGFASVEVAGDQVVRRFPEDPEALWRVALALHRSGTGQPPLPANLPGPGARVRYSGGDDVGYAAYYQALDPAGMLPEGFFRGRIALVGLNLKTSPDPARRAADTYATPHLRFSRMFAPGVDVHAQFIARAQDGGWLAPVGSAWTPALCALVLAGGVGVMRRWHLARCTAYALGTVAVLAGASFVLFETGRTWLPVALPAGTALLLYIARGLSAYADEFRQRQAIRRAFESYVAPEVVAQMTAHPERLALGGERRELTVLFTDLAGFTAMSEGLPPEEVARVLNEHLTRMTQVVLAHGGTIDKFIGDAVMAFWGAPLDDPDHARHAVEAAIGMQAEMARWRAQAAGTIPEAIAMRVGINTGIVIVGNLGSRLRFDYTVIGDAVNLASRLESANRVYGTGILLTESTAARLRGAVALRHVDRIRVKGKRDAIEVFTPASAPPREDEEEAMRAYRAADWDRAQALWSAVLARDPGDGIAATYLSRIERLRRAGVPPGWDGTESLDAK